MVSYPLHFNNCVIMKRNFCKEGQSHKEQHEEKKYSPNGENSSRKGKKALTMRRKKNSYIFFLRGGGGCGGGASDYSCSPLSIIITDFAYYNKQVINFILTN